MSDHDQITYYLIAIFAAASMIFGYYEFLVSTKLDRKELEVDPVHDEGTHRQLEMQNEY